MPRYNLTSTALLIGILLCANVSNVRAQEPDATKFDQTYEAAAAKAQADCAALWADHAFDPFRDRIPFGLDKPAFAMLTNSARLRPSDRPIADLAVKTLEKCREAWAPAFAMLPAEVNGLEQGLQLKQDALIANLYKGKITFGDYNVGMDRLNSQIVGALSGIPQSPEVSPSPGYLPTSS